MAALGGEAATAKVHGLIIGGDIPDNFRAFQRGSVRLASAALVQVVAHMYRQAAVEAVRLADKLIFLKELHHNSDN